MMSGLRIIKHNECGVLVVLGKPMRILRQGLNFVHPFVSHVEKIQTDSHDWEQRLDWFSQRFPEISSQIQSFKTSIKGWEGSRVEKSEVVCPKCGYRFKS